MYGEVIGLVYGLFLLLALQRLVAVSIMLALAKTGLPGECQDVTVEVAILCGCQWGRLKAASLE